MDRAAFLAEMNDLLDGCAGDAQAERLAQNLRDDPSRQTLAAELHLQDDMLMELAGLRPSLPTSAQILLRAKKRARIIGFEGAASGTTGPAIKPPSNAPAPAAPAGEGRRRKGAAKPERERHRTGTRPYRPVRSNAEGIIKLVSMVVGVAALIAMAVYLTRDPGKPTKDPQVAKTPETPLAPEKKDTPPDKAPPKLPADPIVSIAGGDYKREGNTLTTDRRSTINVKLADGSAVELQPRCSVSFAAPTAEFRNQLEMARGWIKVQAAKDPRTFRVSVGANRIEVVGTEFIVEVPDREQVAGGQAQPARIEVSEGVVRLSNGQGELLVEKASAVIHDSFKPQRIVEERETKFHGFSGLLKVRIITKSHRQLVARVMNVDPDGENRLEGAANKLREQVIRLFPAGEEAEGAHERAMHLLEQIKVMDDPVLNVWMHENRFMFTAKP